MKKTLLILFIFTNSNFVFAHKEWVHQYLAWESYLFMQQELRYGYPELRDHMGFGNFGYGSNEAPWLTGFVGTGAWREDSEDPVYRYGGIGGGWTPSVTHFWTADEGDEAPVPVPSFGDVENAWMKAQVYLFGGKKIFFFERTAIPGVGEIYGRFYKYNSLIDFYLTGNCTYEGYLNLNLEVHNQYSGPVPMVMAPESRYTYVYGILGRVAHLLGDVGVPAHAHGDAHNCGFPSYDQDTYELAMGDNLIGGCNEPHSDFLAKDFNRINATSQGSLISEILTMSDHDAMKYLFYTSNQIADHFKSDGADGNNNLPKGTNAYLLDRYTALGDPPTEVDVHSIASESFIFSIRATASLFHWFARKTNQPITEALPPTVGYISCNLPDPWHIFWNQTSTLSINILGGTPPFSYQWEIGKCGSFAAQNCLDFGGDYPPGFTRVNLTSNSTLVLRNTDYQTKQCNWPSNLLSCGNPTDAMWMNIKVKVSNPYGSVTKYFYNTRPVAANPPPPPPPGCPYIYVFNSDSGYWVADNNILHRSEFTEFAGQTIEDLYLLKVKPGTIDGRVSINIKENENNDNLFDKIKLYAVDHPVGTLVGVTEDNEIILYDNNSIQSADYADLNNRDITELIQYDYNGGKILSGNKNDSVNAYYEGKGQLNSINYFNKKYKNIKNFSSRGSGNVALIGDVSSKGASGGGVQRKTRGAYLDYVINGNNYTKSFARRELTSPVIIPITTGDDVLDHVAIRWQNNFKLKYFSVTPIMYEGFIKVEMPLSEAIHSIDGDIKNELMNLDNNSASLDSSANINLWFNNINPPQNGMIRDYVFETNGTSIFNNDNLGRNSIVNIEKNSTSFSFDYKLFSNYPNPFNPVTNIKYQIAKEGITKIKIFNNLGQLVKVLVNEFKTPGTYQIDFDGSNFASGIYYYRIEVNNFLSINKMLLIK